MTRRAEQSAAWEVMRADRRFLWLYAATAAACSLAGNLGHARTAGSASPPPLWMAYGWAAVPVLLLMLAAYAKPTLGRMLALARSEGVSGDGGDRLSSVVVWGVFVGAFVWSAYGLWGFTVALGVPPAVAWLAPATIDVALFGALRGLVLTAPIAARMKQGLGTAAAGAVAPRAASTATPERRTAASNAAAPAAPAPTAAPTAASRVAAPAVPAAAPSTAQHDRAAAVVASGVTTKPVADVAAVLQLLDGGASGRSIQAQTRIDARTVARIRKADAAAAAPASTLTAV